MRTTASAAAAIAASSTRLTTTPARARSKMVRSWRARHDRQVGAQPDAGPDPRGRSMKTMAELSLRRPVTAVMFYVSMVVIGLIAAFRLPLEQFPDISFPFVFVQL